VKRSDEIARAMRLSDAAATDRCLLATLPRPVAQRLASRLNGEVILKEGASREDMATALAVVEAACPETSGDVVIQELAKVRSVTISREKDEGDAELSYVTMASQLTEFPPDVIRDACTAWMRCEKFRPSLAELREYCWARFRPRHSLRNALRVAVAMEDLPQEVKVTPEERAKVLDMIEKVKSNMAGDFKLPTLNGCGCAYVCQHKADPCPHHHLTKGRPSADAMEIVRKGMEQ